MASGASGKEEMVLKNDAMMTVKSFLCRREVDDVMIEILVMRRR